MYGQSVSVICQKRCRGPLADPEIFKVRTNPGFHIEGGDAGERFRNGNPGDSQKS